MSFGGFSQSLELVDFFLKRRDAFLQIGFALREGLDLARFYLAFQVHGTELGDFTIEYTNLFARRPLDPARRFRSRADNRAQRRQIGATGPCRDGLVPMQGSLRSYTLAVDDPR